MKQKIKFKALSYQGKVILFTKEFDCPDFKVIPANKIGDLELTETSIESQVIDWLDEQDKTDLMIEKDLGVIIDYWIPKKNKSKLTIVDYLKSANLSEQLTLDLIAVYKEIKPLLKGKSIETQIKILFSHINIAYQSSSAAYQRITAILQSPTSDDARKLLS